MDWYTQGGMDGLVGLEFDDFEFCTLNVETRKNLGLWPLNVPYFAKLSL